MTLKNSNYLQFSIILFAEVELTVIKFYEQIYYDNIKVKLSSIFDRVVPLGFRKILPREEDIIVSQTSLVYCVHA